MRETQIKTVKAREVLDSRGNPTVEAEVLTKNGILGSASVPSGASTGAFEACEMRDDDSKRYFGKGVLKAVSNVNNVISKIIVGHDVTDQMKIDRIMCEADGTEKKSRLGANAILAVSLACAKAGAKALGLPLYKYVGGTDAHMLPVPMMNIINGGRHADNSLNCQEFMIMPGGAESFSSAIRNCVQVYHTLKKILAKDGLSTAVGDEGGYAPNLKSDEEAIKLILKAIEEAGFKPGDDFSLAIDPATSEMYEMAKEISEEDKYYFWKTDKLYEKEELMDMWQSWTEKYPIISIEDAMAEEDWDGWERLTKRIGNKVQLVGDDLFVTNTKRLENGIKSSAANSILIKLNQIGTLTQALNAVNAAHKAGYTTVISHRSGETEDTFIADLAVAVNAGQIKTGAPARTDRTCKYNRLLKIEEELSKSGVYPGAKAFYNLR